MAETNGSSNGGPRISLVVLIAILTILGSGGSVLFAVHWIIGRPIEQAQERLERNLNDRISAIRIDMTNSTTRIDGLIAAETQRNNNIGERLAREESVTELFRNGKLLLNGGAMP